MPKPAPWYVREGSKEHGPFQSRQIKRLAAEGKLKPDSYVRRGDKGPFMKASKVKGLFADVTAKTPKTPAQAPPPAQPGQQGSGEANTSSFRPVLEAGVAGAKSLFERVAAKAEEATAKDRASDEMVQVPRGNAVARPVADGVPRRLPCPICGEIIAETAVKCRHCGEFLDGRPQPGQAPPAAAQAVVNITNVVGGGGQEVPRKSRATAIFLALFLGGFGGHNFYMGRTTRGWLSLLFCWTFIPAIVAGLEALYFLTLNDRRFQTLCET